jgi:LDH2 family malate/lactate/ureidoglycolate dehydrogenase
MPIAGYKGSGLALVLGLLGGPLNGAAFGREVKELTADQVRETNTGHVVIAIDVARFRPLDEFTEEIGRHLRDLASSKRLPGFDEIHIPGQGRAARRDDRIKNGVPLSETLLRQVDEVANSLGIEPLMERIVSSE